MAGPIHEFSHLPRPRQGANSAWRASRNARADGAPPKVGLIYNPRSHHNKGQDLMEVAEHLLAGEILYRAGKTEPMLWRAWQNVVSICWSSMAAMGQYAMY